MVKEGVVHWEPQQEEGHCRREPRMVIKCEKHGENETGITERERGGGVGTLGAAEGRPTGGRALSKGPTGMGHFTGGVQMEVV